MYKPGALGKVLEVHSPVVDFALQVLLLMQYCWSVGLKRTVRYQCAAYFTRAQVVRRSNHSRAATAVERVDVLFSGTPSRIVRLAHTKLRYISEVSYFHMFVICRCKYVVIAFVVGGFSCI
jgi:hypothetical protein